MEALAQIACDPPELTRRTQMTRPGPHTLEGLGLELWHDGVRKGRGLLDKGAGMCLGDIPRGEGFIGGLMPSHQPLGVVQSARRRILGRAQQDREL